MKNDKECINRKTIANENIVSSGDFNSDSLYFYHSTSVKV